MENNLPLSTLKLDWCSYQAVQYACIHWHYSKSVPAGKLVRVGVWEHGTYIGCVLFSYGANKYIGSPYQLKQQEICELTRVALNKHEAPVSRILTIAIKMLRKLCPKLRLIVSYADVDQNHTGGIYKATNWLYEGIKGEHTSAAFMIRGKKVHPKTVYSMGVRQPLLEVQKHLDPNATVFITKGKHKYLMPLDESMKLQIAKLAQPYPHASVV